MHLLVSAGGNSLDVLSFCFPNISDVCFVDDYKTGCFNGYEVIGTINDLINHKIEIANCTQIYNCLGSSGNNSERNNIYKKITDAGFTVQSLVMSDTISGNVNIGENVLINLGVQVHHDCYIGNNCVISPGTILCGNVKLEDNVFIGAGAIIKQGVTIGKNAIIGIGSVVLENVPTNETWVGNPAKKLR